MKRATLSMSLLVVAVGSVLPSACAGPADDAADQDVTPTVICTSPPASNLLVQVHGEDAAAYTGRPMGLRILYGPSLVMGCSTGMVAAGGTFDRTISAFGPIGDATAELWLSSDASPSFGIGDRRYRFHVGTDGILIGDDCDLNRGWSLDVDAATPTSEITWALGTACPGG